MSLSNEQALPIRAGDIIGGKYRVDRVIGQGGMGTVVRARHTLLVQDVAIKVLAPELASNPQYATRFMREAQAAVTIKGEHVVRVLDVGTQNDGASYMVMEYLEGKDLGALVETQGPLHVSDAVDYILQACEALAEAHAAGLTHRDIKPSNLFLTRRSDGSPLVKLLDFGIAKPSSATDNRLTATGMAMGSPSYMSPEQVRNAKTVDHRADIWSLGATLHELLTGLPPFVADTFPALCAAIIADSPTPLCKVRPDAPPELETAIQKCLEKKPEQRPPDVGALARMLAPFGSPNARTSAERATKIITPGAVVTIAEPPAVRISLTSSPNASAFAATAASTSVSVPAPVTEPSRRRSPLVVLAGVMALGAIGGIFVATRDKAPAKNAVVAKDGPAKPVSPTTTTAAPAITPAGQVTAAPDANASPSAALPGVVPPIASVPLVGTLINRPATSARPASSKTGTAPTSTIKKPAYDPFAEQH